MNIIIYIYSYMQILYLYIPLLQLTKILLWLKINHWVLTDLIDAEGCLGVNITIDLWRKSNYNSLFRNWF